MIRFLNMVYAKAFGYFWIPCPVCGKDFGGHEVYNGPGLVVEHKKAIDPLTGKRLTTFILSKSVCSAACSLKAADENKAKGVYLGAVPIGPYM